MLKKIKAYVHTWDMLTEKDRVIVGVSGGADSICLLCVLLELQKDMPFSIIAVHVNHGLRGKEAEQDEAFAKAICNRNHVPCIIYHKNIELISKNRKQSMEETGREVRLQSFYEVMEQYGGTKIALAHHKNDNVETLFMNLARGTMLKGFGGIRPVNGAIIRPLLCVDRKDIEEYLAAIGQEYCTDSTNKDNVYTRNKVRNEVIPYLEQEMNHKAVDHIAKSMEMMRELYDYVQVEMEQHYTICVDQDQKYSYRLSKAHLNRMPLFLRKMLIRHVVVKLSGSERDVEAVHVELIDQLLEKQTGKTLDMPYGIQAVRTYEGIRLWIPGETDLDRKEVPLDMEKCTPINMSGTMVAYCVMKFVEGTAKPFEKTFTKRFNYDIIKNTVVVRTRKIGDYIMLGSNGSKKTLKSYFIDQKIPREIRDQILLIAEGSHILWIVGYRVSKGYEINEHTTRILEIEIDGGEKNGRDSKGIADRERSR